VTFLDSPPPQAEAEFLESVRKLARLLGWAVYHTHNSQHSEAGFPDLVMVKRPRVLFVELKSDRGRVTPAQRAWIEELRACEQEAYIIRPKHIDALTRLLR
jgi:Holliday junction resolvase